MNSTSNDGIIAPELREAMLAALPYAMALLDRTGKIVWVSDAWRRFAEENSAVPGLAAPRAGIGLNFVEICDSAVGSGNDEAFASAAGLRMVLEGKQVSFEIEYPSHAPEESRWFLMRVQALTPSSAGILVIHADITARKLNELHLRDNELRLQLALEATGNGLWDWDLQTGKAILSQSYYALSGYSPDEAFADYSFFRRLVHPEDWPAVQRTIEAHLRGETPSSEITYRMVTASGDLRWILGKGRVVEWNDAGTPVRLIGHITDVSEYKRIEEALRKSEMRYRAVVEDQTEVIARILPDGTILFANEVYCRFFGKDAGELIGKRWHPIAHSDDLPMIEAQLAMLSPTHPVVTIENRVFAGDGSLHWMQFINRGFFDEDGKLTEIQSVGRDIDVRKQLEIRQHRLLHQLTRLGREMIRLQEHERIRLARELHDDLSQQLAAIRAHAGAIRRHSGIDAKPLADAVAIESTAGLIYQASHRIMEGLHPQLLESSSLTEILRSYLDGWASKTPGIATRLRTSGIIDAVPDEMRTHVFRIVQEGLTNVHLHASASNVRLFLREHIRSGGRWLSMVLRDNGVGVDLDIPLKGYGLILMRERVLSLDGDIQLSSRPGRGLRIFIEIPLPT